jgi:hypothetical protein
VSFFHFHTWGHNISMTFTLVHPFIIFSPLPLVPTPQTRPVLPSYSPFLKKYFFFVSDSYTKNFIVTYLYIYVLYAKLVHSLSFSPFYLSPLLMGISTCLKIIYSFLYRKYISYIHLNFLFLPSRSY